MLNAWMTSVSEDSGRQLFSARPPKQRPAPMANTPAQQQGALLSHLIHFAYMRFPGSSAEPPT